MKIWQQNLLKDAIAIALGILLVFAFAPYEVFPLAVIAPAGLLSLCLNITPKKAFWRGFLFGLGFFGAGVYWIFISIHFFGDVPNFLAFIITAVLIAILALFPATTTYLTTKFFPINNATKWLCAFPAIWTISEWIRSFLCTGFPWLFLGYSQTNSPLKGYAPFFSVYGITLAILVSSGCLVSAITNVKEKNYRQIYLQLFMLLTIWVVGSALTFIPWTTQQHEPISIALVQGNVPQAIKWSPEHLQLSLDRYRQLTEPLFKTDAQLIIWPEAAIPMSLQSVKTYIQELDDRARASNKQLILGIPIQAESGDDYYNAVVTLGKERKVYLKTHLVPFGEYTPFAQYLTKILTLMDIPTSSLIPGKVDQPFMSLNEVKILTSICYEIGFPELIRTKDADIGMLLTVTNDAWFGESSAQAQHLQMAAMRAIELQRPVVMVGNDGITAVIAPSGKIDAIAPQRKTYVLMTTVQPMQGSTFWMSNGMDPLLIILLIFLFIAVRQNLKARLGRSVNSTVPNETN